MKTQDIRNMGQAFLQVLENQKAAVAKKLAKASASSEKGKAAVTLPKAPFEIPEDIPATERTAFHGAAAGAHKAGKSHFAFQGKKYPVTMKKDTAQAIADDVKESKDDDEADDATVRMMKDNPKMRGQKGPGGMKSLDRKAHSAVRKALQDNSKETATANATIESTRWPIFKRILEKADRAAHYKGATKPETMQDKYKGKGAKDMAADAKLDNPDVAHDEQEAAKGNVSATVANVKKSPMRRNDNAKGDTKIISSATKA